MSKLIKVLTLLGFTYFVIYTACPAQITKVGPVPPPGTDRGLRTPTKAQIIIPDVPAYLWQHGCGPTAIGMVVGYYDSHGLPDLVVGDATYQTSAVNAMIATDSDDPVCGRPYSDHYQDYSCPIDDEYVIPDRSETGGAHPDNCVADFHLTSRSIIGMPYGWSWSSDAPGAFINYCHFANPGYVVEAYNYSFAEFTWEDYKTEIDNNLPLCLLVDSEADGNTDHFVTGIGYDETTMEYGIYDTWDHEVHWYPWEQMAPGRPFGIWGVTLFRCLIMEGETLRVPSEYATIQDGINAAQDGDMVLVADGLYTGPGNRNIFFDTRLIQVVSENGPEHTIIDCQGTPSNPRHAFVVYFNSTSFASINGFTIKGGFSPGGAAISLHNSNIRIMNCIITDNFGFLNGSVACFNSNPLILNCTISLNQGPGVYVDPPSSPTLRNTIVWENVPDEIVAEEGSNPTVTYCDIRGGWPGGTTNIRLNPMFVDPYNGNFNTFHNSPCIDAGSPTDSDPDGSPADIGLYYSSHPAYYDAGGIVHVATGGYDETGDGSSENPFGTIRMGLRASRHGDTIIVGNGTYNENINFYGHNAYLTSPYYRTGNMDDINATIIDGSWPGYGSVVTFDSDESEKAVIAGFTIQNGYGQRGGGIYCAYSSPSIISNFITGNGVGQYGGGIYCLYASPLIKGNLIHENTALGDFGFGGGIYAAFGSPTVINCTSVNNMASEIGGSVYAWETDIQITNTISWANNSGYKPEIYMQGGGTVNCCNVEGGQWGEGNIDSDPMFCDFDNFDYTINSNSPCMDGGMNGAFIGAFGPGCGDPMTMILPDTILVKDIVDLPPQDEEKNHEDPLIITTTLARICLGNYSEEKSVDEINLSSLYVNDFIKPAEFTIVRPFGYFFSDVLDAKVRASELVEFYGPAWDTATHTYTVTGEFDDGEPISLENKLVIIGYIAGDANFDWQLDVLDILCLIDFMFKDGDPPKRIESCDTDCDGIFSILDIVNLIDFKFKDGAPPRDGCD
jgi:hypothetical protein